MWKTLYEVYLGFLHHRCSIKSSFLFFLGVSRTEGFLLFFLDFLEDTATPFPFGSTVDVVEGFVIFWINLWWLMASLLVFFFFFRMRNWFQLLHRASCLFYWVSWMDPYSRQVLVVLESIFIFACETCMRGSHTLSPIQCIHRRSYPCPRSSRPKGFLKVFQNLIRTFSNESGLNIKLIQSCRFTWDHHGSLMYPNCLGTLYGLWLTMPSFNSAFNGRRPGTTIAS